MAAPRPSAPDPTHYTGNGWGLGTEPYDGTRYGSDTAWERDCVCVVIVMCYKPQQCLIFRFRYTAYCFWSGIAILYRTLLEQPSESGIYGNLQFHHLYWCTIHM